MSRAATHLIGTGLADPVLDAVRAPDGTLRVFLSGRDGPLAPDAVVARDGVRPRAVVTVAGGTMIVCAVEGDGPHPLPLAGPARPVGPTHADPAPFAGRNVLMGIRNGEPFEAVADWLRWHVDRHGADAALILDRARPDDPTLHAEDIAAGAPPGLAHLAVVRWDRPLGAADGVSERHPFGAPDAPGKDRMEPPAPDPWTAPLADLIVLEALRWRFLSRADAVAFVDPTDLIVPAAGDRGVFEAATAAPGGVVQLVGRRIYPWRVRPGATPGFGDHVCDRFDDDGGNRRWAVDMARIPADTPFRLVRVGALRADPRRSLFFYRAMALRVREGGRLPIAPKSSLSLDDGLLALARDTFGADPVLPPEAATAAPSLPADLPGRTAIVTCMKNEGPFVLEWLAHHRAIGVDDVLVYTNDCTDGTDRLLDVLQDHGVVAHRANPVGTPGFAGLKPQHAALQAAEDEPILARAGWAVCMDVDEFVNVHAGSGTLRDLFAAMGDANLISMTWRLFGNADQHRFGPDVPLTARFTACAPELVRKPHQAWGFKTLFRNLGLYKKLGVHRPKGLRPETWEQIAWVNGSGAPMPRRMLRTGWRSTVDTYGYGLVTLNHYAVRDAESFLVKRDRGRVNHVERDQGLGYWFRMNNNAETDATILRRQAATRAEMDTLLALPGVAEAHAACIAAHRARIAELRARPDMARFYAEITSPRMERLSRMHRHFGANVFLAGPDCVPDAVWGSEPADDFFFTVDHAGRTTH